MSEFFKPGVNKVVFLPAEGGPFPRQLSGQAWKPSVSGHGGAPCSKYKCLICDLLAWRIEPFLLAVWFEALYQYAEAGVVQKMTREQFYTAIKLRME